MIIVKTRNRILNYDFDELKKDKIQLINSSDINRIDINYAGKVDGIDISPEITDIEIGKLINNDVRVGEYIQYKMYNYSYKLMIWFDGKVNFYTNI